MIRIEFVRDGIVEAETTVTSGGVRFLDSFLARDDVQRALRQRRAYWLNDHTLRIENGR